MAEHRKLAAARMEATGKALGAIRAQMREEMAAEIGSLRADLAVEKAHRSGDVIDLPAVLPMRSVRRAT